MNAEEKRKELERLWRRIVELQRVLNEIDRERLEHWRRLKEELEKEKTHR